MNQKKTKEEYLDRFYKHDFFRDSLDLKNGYFVLGGIYHHLIACFHCECSPPCEGWKFVPYHLKELMGRISR